MPTDVRIQQVSCRLDNDQDPEVFVCDYRFQELATGDPITGQAENQWDESPDSAMSQLASDLDVTIV